MYSLDINFLNDREENPIEGGYSSETTTGGGQVNWTPAVLGALVGLVPALAVLGVWGLTQRTNADLETQIAELTATVEAQGRVQERVNAAEARAKAAEDDARALVTVFDQIKPWSAMMANLQETIPSTVQVRNIQQSEVDIDGQKRQQIELKGLALSFNDVNDFVVVLRRSPFLDPENTSLVNAQLINNPATVTLPEDAPPGIEVEQPRVVEYTITSALGDRPASDLLDELENTLAVGLTSRIQTLQDKGAF
ncbi:MAG: hypothetical protein F6K09_33305 [Merismopedia sp. SIO2A8]|nr:hypothetical protein [Symploca sp. SIO2B6]NET53362.1 hypothetical protein [Merismopedia sp. SIO2A8]